MLSAPLILYIISNKFEPTDVIVYFLCLSFLNMRTIFEGGMTNVIKREYALNIGGDVRRNLSFSVTWFAISSLLLFVFSSLFASFYFYFFVNNISDFDLILIVIACLFSALRVASLPIDAYLDGLQYQKQYRLTLLYSAIVSVTVNAVSIFLGYTLLAIVLSQLSLVVSFVFFSMRHLKRLGFNPVMLSVVDFKNYFNRHRAIIVKTMATWTCGFFFWNGTALVVNLMPINENEIASILFSFAMIKAIYDISFAFIQSQFSKISYAIGKFDFDLLKKLTVVNSTISFVIFISGSFLLYITRTEYPDFGLFDKLLQSQNLISLMVFFFLVLVKSVIHNIVRSFQEEPFLFYVLYNACAVMLGLYCSYFFKLPFFLVQSILIVPMLVLSIKILKNKFSI
ncbi:hypothetical protein [Vibrio sp. NC2]|uniref:hypothetical protein n=1 Tax=Vibrio sp. NC2 TaxID=2974562 RepID=UPI0021A66C1B|nr:hypothetical protein [Vibrio sp. NC2]MCT4349531.1 hypothetical protein [Vibrio sp. NC2]